MMSTHNIRSQVGTWLRITCSENLYKPHFVTDIIAEAVREKAGK